MRSSAAAMRSSGPPGAHGSTTTVWGAEDDSGCGTPVEHCGQAYMPWWPWMMQNPFWRVGFDVLNSHFLSSGRSRNLVL